jgi:hypothetical protein
MARLVGLLSAVLFVVAVFHVSATNVVYSVTFLPCVPGMTCPMGNPSVFNQTFALNGMLSPNLTLKVGDRLEFDLVQNVSIHPLTICQNSPSPQFCRGAASNNQLNTPITLAGTNTSVTFTAAGIYYYGCYNHPGMGATINVTTTNVTTGTNAGHQLSVPVVFVTIFALLTMIIT